MKPLEIIYYTAISTLTVWMGFLTIREGYRLFKRAFKTK